MHQDDGSLADAALVGAGLAVHEVVRWRAQWTLHKFDDPTGDIGRALQAGADLALFSGRLLQAIEQEGNLLLYGGASCLWQCLIGNGTATAGQALTYFNNGNAHIGVGDSNTAAAATQTDLQAGANKLRKAMDATYPQHTDATTSGAASIVFRSTFGTSDANFAWNEWGIFNGASGGRMLNRKVEALGTKTSAATWVFTCTLSLG